jgi:uncharacterized protein
MHVAIIGFDRADAGGLRAETRPAHLAYLKALKARILEVGPLLSADGSAPIGSLIIVEVDDLAAAEAIAAADPYGKAGLFAELRVVPWRRVTL